jgi:AcrR family transcriptional regulator
VPAPTKRTTRTPATSPRHRSRSTDISSHLLDAALSILASDGVDAITVRNVAAHAGVAPAGVYSRYDGKPGLLDALLSQGFDALHDALVATSGPNARARLVNATSAYRTFALKHPEHYQLMFDHKRAVAMSSESFARAEQAFGELVSRVKDAQDAKVLTRGSATEIAQQIWSGLHGAVSFELNGIGFAKDPAKTYTHVVQTMLRGLAA